MVNSGRVNIREIYISLSPLNAELVEFIHPLSTLCQRYKGKLKAGKKFMILDIDNLKADCELLEDGCIDEMFVYEDFDVTLRPYSEPENYPYLAFMDIQEILSKCEKISPVQSSPKQKQKMNDNPNNQNTDPSP